MSNKVNPIVKRIYYAAEIRLRSPLAISNGENETTDMDVLRNREGEPFIPGTSIAGAFRNFLLKKKDEDGSFGFSRDEDGRMSSVFISDFYFKGTPVITIRDRVQLSDDRQVQNKFDMEVIETGAEGVLYFNYVIRENSPDFDADWEAAQLFCGMERGEIRFGGSKNKGLGRLELVKIYRSEFTRENLEEWISFDREVNEGKDSAYQSEKEYKEWMQGYRTPEEKYYRIKIPLKLTGGISIRKYSAEPMKADFEHITCNGKPVVPGASWSGAIRADAKNILLELGFSVPKCTFLLNRWFGYVNVKKRAGRSREKEPDAQQPFMAEGKDKESSGCSREKEPNAQQSCVVIGESIIRNAVRVPMTRNKISRFDASTITGALYSEITCCGGETDLEIMVKKDTLYYHALLAVLELIIQDICKGYVAVGGQTAVGRGIFSGSLGGFLEEKMRKRGYQELIYLRSDF